jgi:hypothetical protein
MRNRTPSFPKLAKNRDRRKRSCAEQKQEIEIAMGTT